MRIHGKLSVLLLTLFSGTVVFLLGLLSFCASVQRNEALPQQLPWDNVKENRGTGPDESNKWTAEMGAGLASLNLALRGKNWNGAEEIVLQLPGLVQTGVDMDHPRAPIHLAIDSGNRHLVQLMLKHGADANQTTFEGEHPLLIALPNQEMLVLLLRSGANSSIKFHNSGLVNQYVGRETRLLHLAVFHNLPIVVTYLLAQDADPNCKNEHGCTPLFVAINSHSLEMVRLLLSHKADVNCASEEGIRPIHLAVREMQHDIVNMLVLFGAEVNVVSNSGVSPLLDASNSIDDDNAVNQGSQGQPVSRALAEFLISKGATEDVFTATALGDVRVVTEALTANPRVPVMTDPIYGRTLLHWAVKHNQVKLVNVLLSHRADINARDAGGETPLHLAVYYDRIDVVKILLSHDADRAVMNQRGESPYQLAVRLGSSDLASLLRGM